MAFAGKQLANGQLAASEGDLYLVPASTTGYVVSIIIVNTDTSARTINLFVKPSGGTSRRVCPKDMSLDPGDCFYFNERIDLDTGDAVRGYASTASVVDYTVYGAEET